MKDKVSNPPSQMTLTESLTAVAELIPQIAAMRKRMYDESILVGFTKEEALILCQKVTPT